MEPWPRGDFLSVMSLPPVRRVWTLAVPIEGAGFYETINAGGHVEDVYSLLTSVGGSELNGHVAFLNKFYEQDFSGILPRTGEIILIQADQEFEVQQIIRGNPSYRQELAIMTSFSLYLQSICAISIGLSKTKAKRAGTISAPRAPPHNRNPS